MGLDPEILLFDPEKAPEALWTAYFDHSEAISAEIDPDDPPLPRAMCKPMIERAMRRPFSHKRLYLAMAGSKAAGHASISVETPDSPSYKDNKHICHFSMSVLPEYRRRGLGSRMLAHIKAELGAEQPQVTELMTPIVLDSGLAFLRKMGGNVALEQGENRLYLNEADWGMVERWASEGVARNPSTALHTVGSVPEEDMQEFCRVYSLTMNQQPLGEISMKVTVTPEQVREGEKRRRADGADHVTIYAKEPDGTVSGLTEIYYLPAAGHKVHQLLTGVREDCRGRGLGKLLKALMLLHIRKNYPSVKYVATGNADSNAPMMAINLKLGFKRRLAVHICRLPLAAQAAGA